MHSIDGIELVDVPDFGQCAVATKDFKAGELILNELPALLINYNADPALSMLKKTWSPAKLYKRRRAFMTLSQPAIVSLYFCNLEQQDRDHLLNRFHLPDVTTEAARTSIAYKSAQSGCKMLRQRQQFLPEIADMTDTDLIAFSLIASANAHALDDHVIGLLYGGTKITHTCFLPNVAVSSRPLRDGTSPDTAKHIAFRDIKAGELLFGSYAKLLYETRDERQRYLMDHKLFSCRCTFCSEPMEEGTAIDNQALQAIRSNGLGAPEAVTRAEDLLPLGWTHPSYARAAADSLSDFEGFLQNPQSVISLSQVERILRITQLLDKKLSDWLSNKADAADEILPQRLSLARALMTRAAIQHETIELCMTRAQDLLLNIRQVIEKRRTWAIGHALEEEYDETLVDLDELVNGPPQDGS